MGRVGQEGAQGGAKEGAQGGAKEGEQGRDACGASFSSLVGGSSPINPPPGSVHSRNSSPVLAGNALGLPREGTYAEAAAALTKELGQCLTGFSFPQLEKLKTVSEAELKVALSPNDVFRMIIDDPRFDMEWHETKGDKDVKLMPWKRSLGSHWGGQRSSTMNVKTGPFGYQGYQEAHRYIYTRKDGKEVFVWSRSGRMPNPPALVPKFTNHAVYMFEWDSSRKLRWEARFGIMGYDGLLRSRVERECRKELGAFENYLTTVLRREMPEVAHTPVARRVVSSRMSARSYQSSAFQTCHPESVGSEPCTPTVTHEGAERPVPGVIPGDSDLAVMPIGALAQIGIAFHVVSPLEVDKFREQLIRGITAKQPATQPTTSQQRSSTPSSSQRSHPPEAEAPDSLSTATFTGSSGTDAPAPLTRECLEALQTNDLLDASDILTGVCSDVGTFRASLVEKLRRERDQPAHGRTGLLHKPGALPPQKRSKGRFCCC